MFFNKSNDSTPTNDEANDVAQNDTPISQDLDAYATRDLEHKVFRLLGFRNGFSDAEFYDNSEHFMIYSGYMPIDKLLSNELDDSLKTFITFETTLLDKEKQCSYKWTDGVKDDIDSALGEASNNIMFSDLGIDCISYDIANKDFRDLWGGELPKINSFSGGPNIYGDFAYGANRDTYYYHIIGGRGGTSSDYVVGKISQIEGDNEVFVDLNAGRLYVSGGNPSEIYSDIEMNTKYKSIDQSVTGWNELGLSDDDFASFQKYRFKFKKATDGTYYFSAVERL